MRGPLTLLCLLLIAHCCHPKLIEPPLCSTCPQTLANTNLASGQCAIHRTCVSCTTTQATYSTVDVCLAASVTCPSPASTPRLRLIKTDNTYMDIDYSEHMSGFACMGPTWSYTDAAGKVISNIRKAICFGTADGFQQSPIDLNTSTAVHTSLYDSNQFTLSYGAGIARQIDYERGYSGFHVEIKEGEAAFFTASHLDARYRLVQYHAHWNVNGTKRGSEHSIDGKFAAAEFHFVHIREDFSTLAEAVGHDGVAVIAVLAELSESDNPLLNPLIEATSKWLVDNPRSTKGVLPDNGEAIFQQNPAVLVPGNHNYLAYTGSLTTGEFQKCVAWNVLTQPITISQKQLNVLGQLVATNFRAEAAIDTRTNVYTSDVKNNRRPIVEKKHRKKGHHRKPYLANNKIEEEEDNEEIELSQRDLKYLHRLIRKYIRKSQLRSKLLEWIR